ncbi:hypothetical protein EW146_g6413 [Bondarzewia mesenterica]|uniref:Uncharacterized protein n=1 Tax=Bondarzewia mesenterica TaxID=1095465 RepID=A0A4S4LQP5_9AGAM|nr:hypothetical protein EW146_g6413 [Bondarzewia mesenterica]
MPVRQGQRGEPPRKRAKLEAGSRTAYIFSNVGEIRASLQSQNQDGLMEALTALRNQFTIKTGEGTVSPQDERLLLAKEWMGAAPGAQELFKIWQGANQRQFSLLALLVSTLSSLLTLLSSHYTYHALGHPILKTLLSPQWMHHLNSFLGGSHNDLIMATLKLFNAVSMFASGRERKTVYEGISWETKSLPKLLFMRRKGKNADTVDMLSRPDIRTLYILLLLSFVDTTTTTSVKAAFLEQRRDTFFGYVQGSCTGSLFGRAQNSRSVLVRHLVGSKTQTDGQSRSLQRDLSFAGHPTLRTLPAGGPDEARVPADLIHHFLLAICTRPGTGISFKDRGWYPRESDEDGRAPLDDAEDTAPKSGRIYNKILGNLLKMLKVNEDARQQELALKIFSACPELVAGYWPSASLTLEPRLSTKWIANISIFSTIISLPVPEPCFLLPNSSLFQPSPPPLSTILENILPSVNTKVNFSRGLQSTSPLVQHCTALALAKCLTKYEAVLGVFRNVETSLEEEEEGGQWSRRRREVEREIRRRVPDFQVVVALSQHKSTNTAIDQNRTQTALLSESSARLLWLYHRCLPALVSEAHFDVGKLLLYLSDAASGNEELPDSIVGLVTLRQLHILRLLQESDQFAWSGKTGALTPTVLQVYSGIYECFLGTHTHLFVMLKRYTVTESSAIRGAIETLVRHVLSESILFQHDPDEVYLWLSSLPVMTRAPGAEAPDGAALMDESEAVVSFLDDAIQRCTKTPYRYLENLDALVPSTDDDPGHDSQRSDAHLSPLIMTVAEQFAYKVTGNHLSPSDMLAIVSFVCKLIFKMAGKQQNLRYVNALADLIASSLPNDRLLPDYPIVKQAVLREVSVMQTYLYSFQGAVVSPPDEAENTAVQEFLQQVEGLPLPASKSSRRTSANELVDWLRLVDCPLQINDIRRLLAVIQRLYKPAIALFLEHLDLRWNLLWDRTDFGLESTEFKSALSFDCLIVQCAPEQLSVQAYRDTLAGAILSSKEMLHLKEHVFGLSAMKELCSSSMLDDPVRQGLDELLKVSVDPSNAEDRRLVAVFSSHWIALAKSLSKSTDVSQVVHAILWIPYLELDALLTLFDELVQNIQNVADPAVVSLLESILASFERNATTSNIASDLHSRLSQLLSLDVLFPQSVTLHKIIVLAIEYGLPVGLDGLNLDAGFAQTVALSLVVKNMKSRWAQRLNAGNEDIAIMPFFAKDTWTDEIIRILAGLLYTSPPSRKACREYLGQNLSASRPLVHFAPVLHAFLDSASHDEFFAEPIEPVWTEHFTNLTKGILDIHQSVRHRSICASCVSSIVIHFPSRRTEFLQILQRELQSLTLDVITADALEVTQQLLCNLPKDIHDFAMPFVDHALQWASRYFTSDSSDGRQIIYHLAALVKVVPDIKAHFVDPVLTAIVQNCLSDITAVRFANELVVAVRLKPLLLNRHLQSIIQHADFYKITAAGAPTRDIVISLLHTLFHQHPTNTCQPSHVQPLAPIYAGSLSESDQMLLSIFHLFEATRKASIAFLLGSWSASSGVISANACEAIESLDSSRLFRSCMSFPYWRQFDDYSAGGRTDEQCYDPVFVVLLCAQMLSDCQPSTALGWVQLFRTNVVSLLIRSLSSKDDLLRDTALSQIGTIAKSLEAADMQEKEHVLHIFGLLKNAVRLVANNEAPPRLPAYTTLLLAHSLHGVFYPANFVYPLTARFLLQRPELDTTDVPMLYNMLYSSSNDWKKERGWILKLLSDAMYGAGDAEWKAFKRRHTWDLLASIWQSGEKDRVLRNGVLEVKSSFPKDGLMGINAFSQVFCNITSKRRIVTSLILKSSLLSWIEMTLQTSRGDDCMSWMKILENILMVTDLEKMESSTGGQWRTTIGRCLELLMVDHATSPNVLELSARLILRLSMLPKPVIPNLPNLLSKCLAWLVQLEEDIVDLQDLTSLASDTPRVSLAPHSSYNLHDQPVVSSARVWGGVVEALWRASMVLSEKDAAWDELTSRLLIWRSMVGEGCEIGEWVRREVMQNMTEGR